MNPILVVGAGPVGLTVALSLARQGVPVQVIEDEAGLTMDQRAGSFHPPTLEMLAPLGVTEEMQRIGIKVPHWQIRDRKQGVIVEWDLGLIADLTPYPYRFHLEQHRLTPILFHKLHAYRHASVRFSTQFISATQDESGVTALTSAGPMKAPWLVACDGGRSLVRKNLGIDFEGFTWPERFIVISTTEDFAAHGFTSNAYVADPKEWAAVFHMPHDRPDRPVAHGVPRCIPTRTSRRCLADEAGRGSACSASRRARTATRFPTGVSTGVHQRVAKEWRAGRVLLAGDRRAPQQSARRLRLEWRAARRDPALPTTSARSGAARRTRRCSTATCASAAPRTSSSCRRSRSPTSSCSRRRIPRRARRDSTSCAPSPPTATRRAIS
jgi:3-(3-hydroxy-phenyl)propionate hydroxylase